MEATEIGTSPDAELANSSLRQACAQLKEGEHPRGHCDRGGLNAGRGGSFFYGRDWHGVSIEGFMEMLDGYLVCNWTSKTGLSVTD